MFFWAAGWSGTAWGGGAERGCHSGHIFQCLGMLGFGWLHLLEIRPQEGGAPTLCTNAVERKQNLPKKERRCGSYESVT